MPGAGTSIHVSRCAQVPASWQTPEHHCNLFLTTKQACAQGMRALVRKTVHGMLSNFCAADSVGVSLASTTDQHWPEPDAMRHIQAMLERVRATLVKASAMVDRSSNVPYGEGEHPKAQKATLWLCRSCGMAWQPMSCMLIKREAHLQCRGLFA